MSKPVAPEHQVTVSVFYMGKYEVTRKEHPQLKLLLNKKRIMFYNCIFNKPNTLFSIIIPVVFYSIRFILYIYTNFNGYFA